MKVADVGMVPVSAASSSLISPVNEAVVDSSGRGAGKPGFDERSLAGFTVGITADRRWEEQAELLRRRGASVLHGPTIRTLPMGPDEELYDVTERLLFRPPDYVIANTGIGMRAWIAAAESWGLGDSLLAMLKDAQVVARGPKASAAVHQAGVPVAARAESERMDELINMLIAIGVEGRTVAFQRHGDDSPETIASLRAAGARVIEIPVYRWILPLDVGPAQSLIQSLLDAKLQAVTFTSAPAVRNLFLIAAELGCVDDVRSSLNSSVIPVTVGPVCAAAASDAGVKSPLVPDRYRIGPMIRTLTDELLDRGIRATIGGTPASICGNDLRLGQRLINLSGREAALLASLLAVAPRVISKTDLLNKVWGGETDPHVIEVTVARLRRRLGDHGVFIQVVPRRGYLVQR